MFSWIDVASRRGVRRGVRRRRCLYWCRHFRKVQVSVELFESSFCYVLVVDVVSLVFNSIVCSDFIALFSSASSLYNFAFS